ncbi:carbohydrate esterase family 16 protein [Rickenella mellea]|uniref:Carbohydrate esterase family 16 protein n=1 Tax=Rickenella mellea TaxID=50990 RepID=A0A4Y7QMF8_9AGAM|nr:carbohydrate esterase family 16 protein [Rickenella mellea]
MMWTRLASFSACASIALALGPSPGQIKNLVTFGDSYTDVGSPADGGTAWPIYAAGYGPFKLFPFARSGATCSNNITARPFPSVFESQLPLYFTEKSNGSLVLDPASTIYTLWIGTNDVGVGGLLTGLQKPGVTIVDTVTCAVNWVKTLYANGARNFLFQNMLPLQKTVLYGSTTYPNRYFNLAHNSTEWSLFMSELVNGGNAIGKLQLQALPASLPGAKIGLFDSYGLFSDMIAHPANYLNGTAPLNVTGCANSCVFPLGGQTSVCTVAKGAARDSFLWWDELHPSEQSDRVVARQITNAIQRKSDQWTTWFS